MENVPVRVSETEIRRHADTYGVELRMSESRIPDDPDFGKYNLFYPASGGAILAHNPATSSPYYWSLEEIADYLDEADKQ